MPALAQAPTTTSPDPSLVTPMATREVSPGVYEVKVTSVVRKSLAPVAQVPIVSSFLRFVAALPVPGQLLESNLFDSGYLTNLNGNRDLDLVSVDQRNGKTRIDMMPVLPLGEDECGPQRPYRPDGRPKRYMLSDYTPEFMLLFYQPPMMGLELQYRGHRPAVENFPNPCLQIMVFEPCVGPGDAYDQPGEPDFKVTYNTPAGQSPPEKHLMFSWEPALFQRFGEPPQWLRVQWVAIPLSPQPGQQDTVFQVDCSRDGNPVGVLAQLNSSVEQGVRLRTAPLVTRIWPGGHGPAK